MVLEITNIINGTNDDDLLNGSSEEDTIEAYAGKDTLSGDEGNDSLNGGSNNDLYIFNQGDGQDTINDSYLYGNYNAGSDTLKFGTGITQSSLTYIGSEFDIIINFTDSSDKITLKNQININNRIEYFEFADGSSLTFSDIESKLATIGTSADDSIAGSYFAESIYGGLGNDTITTESGNDTVYGEAGNDRIIGSLGNDKLNGDTGDDTIEANAGIDTLSGNEGNDSLNGGSDNDLYIFNQGDGQDTINDSYFYGSYNAGNDTLKFGAGITQSSFKYSGSESDIIINFIDSSDKITLKNHININNRIETFKFDDGSSLAFSDIENKLATIGTGVDDSIAGSYFAESIYGGLGNDTISTGSGNDTVYGEAGNDSIIGSFSNDKLNGNAGDDTMDGYAGSDTLSGGEGDDYLNGGAGNDTYLFNKGDGQDIIYDFYINNDYNAGNDTLKFGTGITQDDLSYTGSDFDIIIDFKNSTDQIILIEQAKSNHRIEAFEFADGSTLSYSDIESKLVITGTDESDYIYGSNLAEKIYGYAGDDQIYGQSGDDTILGSEGSDGLYGGDGNDTYVFNKGDGQDIIYDYHASVNYDAGNDTLKFGSSIVESETIFTNFNGDLIITFANSPNDKITVIGHYSNSLNKIENFEFTPFNQIDGDANNNKLTGTAEDDSIRGFEGADTLIGNDGYDNLFGDAGDDILLGGQGTDTLTGGMGNDSYVINDLNDIINEDTNAGIDTIYTSLTSYTLGTDIENLTLTGYNYDNDIQNFVEAGKGHNGIGNSLDNDILGNNLNNNITGGQGNDYIKGGAGNDTYNFNYNDGVDFIKDTSGTDTIYFEASVIKNTAIFYKDASNLYIDYGTTEGVDKITVEGKDSIERIELSSGEYLTNDDINLAIQEVITYAEDNSIPINSFDDVRSNATLMSMITTAWN